MSLPRRRGPRERRPSRLSASRSPRGLPGGHSTAQPGALLAACGSSYTRNASIVLALEEAMEKHRIFTMSFASVYPLYVQKAEKKGRKKQEVDEVICWLTGYSPRALAEQLERKKDFESFFREAPALHPNANKITGVVCGVRLEEIEDPLMRQIRYLDKLVDELAKGRPMDKILRT
jgi:hypothetical protein